MSNSTPTYDEISESQAGKAVTANQYFDAVSPASAYGRRASTSSGLTWGFYGATITLLGVLTQIANGSILLTASTTNYIEINPATGAVTSNTTGFTAGRIPLYSAVTGVSTVTSYTDHRMSFAKVFGILSKAMTDANTTLTQAEAKNEILQFTGTLTAGRNIVIPLVPMQYTVFNNTTGGFALTFIGATGTGIAVAATRRAIVYADGTNVVRVTADT